MKGLGDYWQEVKRAHESLPDRPVDVVGLARRLGVEVYRAKGWDDNISGMIRRDEDGEAYSIYVNDSHSETRQRFTIAHELAHLMLHQPLIGDGIADDVLYRSGLSNGVEAEANAMAADILMPMERVLPLWRDTDKSLHDMAGVFNVSPQAMGIRLGVPADEPR